MLTLLSEVHFWTFKDSLSIRDTDYGAFKYYDKKNLASTSFQISKKTYAEKRGVFWTPPNKRPGKLRDSLKELEELLDQQRVIASLWRDSCTVLILFGSGHLVNIAVNPITGDVASILFDKFLVGKLTADYLNDFVLTNHHAICSFNEHQLSILYMSKPVLKRISHYRKFAQTDAKITTVELEGPPGKRVDKHLSANVSGDMLLVWWKSANDEVYPWRPVVKDVDRANVHIYKINGSNVELSCYFRTEHEILNISFSHIYPNIIHVVEQKVSRKGEVVVENCEYEVIKSKLQRTSMTSIPLQTHVCCSAISPDDSKLLLGCIDGSLVLYDSARAVTNFVKAAFIATLLCWHPDSSLIIVSNERSQFQCFDVSLSGIKMQLINEDIAPATIIDFSSYFKHQTTLLSAKWNVKFSLLPGISNFSQADSLVLLLFERGPIAVLRMIGSGSSITPDALVAQYLSVNQVDKAINILLCLDWNSVPSVCLSCLHLIINHIFRLPFTSEREVQIQTALGSFHMPLHSINPSIEMEYGDPVRDLTRRFFHQLLRYQLFEKAFRLAIDLNEHDLFLDLYYYAKSVNNMELAQAAWEKSQEIADDCSVTGSSQSDCSRSSCSKCSHGGSTSEYSDENDLPPAQLPPPLPVVRTSIPSSSVTISNAHKQKVKFSDTVTQITVPNISQIDQTPEVSADIHYPSQGSSRITANLQQLSLASTKQESVSQDNVPITKNYLRFLTKSTTKSNDHKEGESKTIKVVHFGVV